MVLVFYADPEAYAMLDKMPEDIMQLWRRILIKNGCHLSLGIKIVAGLDEAVQHIQIHSTGHSDGIIE